jgi:putative endonuclease
MKEDYDWRAGRTAIAPVLPRRGGNAKNRRGIEMSIVYILKSIKDSKYYYGSTENINKRIKDHNAGKVRSTKGRRPLVLHYYEEFASMQEARKRENYFKSIDGYNWLKKKGII